MLSPIVTVSTGGTLEAKLLAFAKRVFFEIVERRDYAGYGAANAGIRLAVQSRFKTDVAA